MAREHFVHAKFVIKPFQIIETLNIISLHYLIKLKDIIFVSVFQFYRLLVNS